MPLTMTLEISDEELDHFRSVMHLTRARAARRSPEEISAAARAAVGRLASGAHSPFVANRLCKVKALVGMLEDEEWQLPEPGRTRVLEGLAYIAESQDLVPDDVPVLGLVDDAIMIELVLRELRHELESYEEFDEFRREEAARRSAAGSHKAVYREDWLGLQRRALHDRMRERRERDLERGGPDFELITRL
ncbi:MAG: YkvA family protein [Steroidobacteraceae bacterium]|nr:YkvA family protein [Steroidobacteraceae bacterium]